jgi:flagellar biosynthesis protein FlhB
MGNIFSKNSLVELVLSVAKATVVGVVAYFVISADFLIMGFVKAILSFIHRLLVAR